MDSTTPNVFLGYSGNALSCIFETLYAAAGPRKVSIIENVPAQETVSFEHSEIAFHRIKAGDWSFDSTLHSVFFSVVRPRSKADVFEFFSRTNGVREEHFTSLVSPHAYIASNSRVGRGCFVEPGVVLAPYGQLGFGVTIKRSVSIGHHSCVDSYVTINPGSHIAGCCHVGQNAVIGMGAIVFDHVQIGANSVIGGGSIVTKSIPEGVLAYGNPCRIVRELY
jgi:acetyltransferase-like isoleucine patch superfamily enzyme